ncbi:uncharacterized protein LOC141535442 [Cotesia typhae]|uniref:uncharacterized protein LOC141535442 n=1 Tax=Cotesia typhae TaxID=2053667 RepID=UPI003D695521
MAVTQLPESRIFGTRWMDYEFFNTRTINDNINYIEKPKKNILMAHWFRNEAEIQRHYSSIWLLVPIGSIFITALVILLMVLFNRCPRFIASTVTGIFGIIIIFIILIAVNQQAVYV